MVEKKDYTFDSAPTPDSTMIPSKYEKLIDNAHAAFNACKDTGNGWGMQYWHNVIASLMRDFGRYH